MEGPKALFYGHCAYRKLGISVCKARPNSTILRTSIYHEPKIFSSLVVAKGVTVGILYFCTGNTYSILASIDNVNSGKATIDVARID